MGVISIMGDSDIVCSAWKHAAVRKDGVRLTTLPEHKDFSTVVATKKVALKDLAGVDPKLLTITPDDELVGYKHVFQTRLTAKTKGERIRSPIGMFEANQTYMDNDAQMLLDHLHEFYN
jgi:hypothetical protein